MPKHSLILLSYNKPDFVDARVSEIGAAFPNRGDFELLIFDNGSDRVTLNALAAHALSKNKFPLRVEKCSPNIGFGRAFNQAVTHIQPDTEIIHLISSDVTILGDVVQAVDQAIVPGAIICQNIIDRPAGWNEFNNKTVQVPYPEGHYLAMELSTWQDIGGFDERFYPFDYEDVDLGMTVSKHEKYQLTRLPSLPVRHLGAGTIGYTPERYEQTCKMRALFAEKWGFENAPPRP